MKDFEDELKNIPEELCIKCGKCCKGEQNKKFPDSLWKNLPEGCGYEGWIFKKKEEIKQYVRKQKESLLDCEVALKTASAEEKKLINNEIEKIEKTIDKYLQYGSRDW